MLSFKEDAPWLHFIYYFSHRLEVSVKDGLDKTFFKEIERILLKLFYFYEKSSKLPRELKSFGEMYNECVPKLYKNYGT